MWTKLGLVFAPSGAGWMTTHAQNPMPQALGGSRYRIHIASRDRQNRSRGGWFEIDLRAPHEVLATSEVPSLDLGELGAFDDSGAMPSALVPDGDRLLLYYTGWSRTVDVPFAFHIGLAASTDGGRTFTRVSRAPVLGRNHRDPFITGAPTVLREGGGLRMWYISATAWVVEAGSPKPKHYYTVKHADSPDGLTWRTTDELCIPYGPGEYAIARPVVARVAGGYEMWFTYRGGADTYRVGTARSADGLRWERDPAPLPIDVSPAGWDAGMICYAYPLVHEGVRYALYNGNAYGETGVGIARDDSPVAR